MGGRTTRGDVTPPAGSCRSPPAWGARGEGTLTDLPAVDGGDVETSLVVAAQHPRQGLPQAALQLAGSVPRRPRGTQRVGRQERPPVLGALQLGRRVDVRQLHPQGLGLGGRIVCRRGGEEEESRDLHAGHPTPTEGAAPGARPRCLQHDFLSPGSHGRGGTRGPWATAVAVAGGWPAPATEEARTESDGAAPPRRAPFRGEAPSPPPPEAQRFGDSARGAVKPRPGARGSPPGLRAMRRPAGARPRGHVGAALGDTDPPRRHRPPSWSRLELPRPAPGRIQAAPRAVIPVPPHLGCERGSRAPALAAGSGARLAAARTATTPGR